MLTHPRLYPTESPTVGAYYFNVNGNDGFMCDKRYNITQHAADLLCQSLEFSKAKTGKGTGWFNRGEFSIADVVKPILTRSKNINVYLKILKLILKILFRFK